jgi:response regulator RpfG family c-di-GMP phosphodiesterase
VEVNAMGGKIHLVSQEGKGTTFYGNILFEPVEEKEPPKEETMDLSSLQVLVAEDNLLNTRILLSMLKSFGIKNIIEAKTGKEAVHLFHANPNVNLILMDVRMPGIPPNLFLSHLQK